MQRDPRAFLWDVCDAADSIVEFTKEIDYETYAASNLLRAGVERKLEIIGEALSQLSKLNPAVTARIPDTPKIVSFRNLLIHGYAVVDHARVWRIVHESLPALRASAKSLLAETREA